MKLQLRVSAEFEIGIKRLSSLLGIECGMDGIPVTAEQGERIGASLKEGVGVIYYREKHHFFRELGVFVENARKSDCFDVTEDGFFKTVGLMFNASRTLPTVKSFCDQLDYLALMGYSMAMLYTEDTIRLENYKYFGYMQNGYTAEELKAIDDYAFDYGIEMIPCLECYGHMQKYLIWEEAKPIMDTPTVLLAREEKTFAFLDELIRTASSCFRSKRIHVGMDEAWNMGRGEFMNRHGFVEPFEIFREFLDRLVKITDKYDLTPMMWSDMYMRIASETGWPYDEKIVVTDELRASVPEGMDLVFWHYGEEPHCDSFMLDKHNQLNRNVIMATGIWDWYTKFPDNEYALETTRFSLDACRNNNVREMMTTRWGRDEFWSTLLGLSLTAELCYRPGIDEDGIRERFDFLSDGAYDVFSAMGQFNNMFDKDHTYPDYTKRFLGYSLFWQDVLEGLYDTHVIERPISQHYAAVAKRFEGYEGKWSLAVHRAKCLFDALAIKCEIAEALHPAYTKGDKETLARIAGTLLPALKTAVEAAHEAEYQCHFALYKDTEWNRYDHKYGALLARIKTAKRRLDDYLEGRIDHIDSLDTPRLYKPIHGFQTYLQIALSEPEI